MSYSFNYPCEDCLKRHRCTDRHVLQGAINGIHSMPFETGHFGAGEINLVCQNMMTEEDTQLKMEDVGCTPHGPSEG